MTEVVELVSNVGFPIAAFLLMWYQCNTTIAKNTEAMLKLEQKLDSINEE